MENEYLAHHGVKGQRWGYRKSINMYPKGPFKNTRLKRALRKSAVKMAKIGYSGVDMGSRKENRKYRKRMRNLMKDYADATYRSILISRGKMAFDKSINTAILNGYSDKDYSYLELDLTGKEDNN